MSRPQLVPRKDSTPDSSRAAVAQCYAYLLERRRHREEKEGGRPTALENAKERIKDDFRAETKSSP